MAIELCILTLNVWGIPLISSDRVARIQSITTELKKGTYDVVSLQEVWSDSDYEYIRKSTEEVFPYSHYFYSGVFGSGLCILSKYPIISALFHSWAVNGYAHRIQHGDWFGGKGVGLCRLLVQNRPVNLYIAHLHAEYDNINDEYKAHRVIQAFDTAQFIESTRSDSILQILAGDLNTEPGDIAFKVLTQTSNLQDTCEDDMIGTNECEGNSYTDKTVAVKSPAGKRIDHILYRAGRSVRAAVQEFDLPFPNRVPGQSFSYSDHEAVFARIQIADVPEMYEGDGICENIYSPETRVQVLEESIEICNARIWKLRNDRIFYVSMALLVAIALFFIADTKPVYGLQTFFTISKFLLSAVVVFFIFMSTIWNTMERHGILSGKLSMEIACKYAKSMRQCDEKIN
ncbi:unnamed protein product [Hermetia illucens]|uniref:sphingomyelin phosphodiesterase n=1 Tax=Hermetia illucens TaxID=343691 RepID=A0A7R8UGM1_HERIL|nr:putative neutral sphingomyelinase [Hermetia illucens]CAD7080239.1 unnamed protein product [Hermetia illucens]